MFDLNMHILKFINLLNALNSIIWKKMEGKESYRTSPYAAFTRLSKDDKYKQR